jgi:hypothetical protein
MGVFVRLLLLAFLLPLSCGDGSSGSANLRVSLTDAPSVDYSAIYVTVSEILIHQSANALTGTSGWESIAVTAAMPVDLLSLQGGVLLALGETTLEPGNYQQIRLVLQTTSTGDSPPNYVVLDDGEEYVLQVPSGDTSGLKINHSFSVTAGTVTHIVLDFDGQKSVHGTGSGTYILRPVISATTSTTSAFVTR